MKDKHVYFFGGNTAEGSADKKELLGGKGANLAEMTNLGIPVPPGFTITTTACEEYYKNNKQYTPALKEEILAHLQRLEKLLGKKLGDPDNPLLVSVRSGAAISMPGMMDTILNLGLNDTVVIGLAKLSNNERFAWDAYRRLISMFGDVVLGIPHHHFEKGIIALKKSENVSDDTQLSTDALKKIADHHKHIVKTHYGKEFPQDPYEQLWAAIHAVFDSWNNTRAIKYRAIHNITNLNGTGVNVQSMVFGNIGEGSGTGVCFSRDAATGENIMYGEYLMNAQGEDIVAGIRTPQKIVTLEQQLPEIYQQLIDVRDKLELHYKDMQDIEFTIERKVLYILQTRSGKRTGRAALKIAIDMIKEGLINKETAIRRVDPEQLKQLFHPMIDPKQQDKFPVLATGLSASPGAAFGRIVFNADTAEEWHAQGTKVLLVRQETSPEDIGGMAIAAGILTSTGGMTSHAAVVARGLGVPCIVGCKDVQISDTHMTIQNITYKEGDMFTIDGSSGNVYAGNVNVIQPTLSDDLALFFSYVDEIQKSSSRIFTVRANADTPEQAKKSRELGAQGIGLCRTEHMFFENVRINAFRCMIVADTPEERKIALQEILPMQQEDFVGIFEAMEGYPVTIRLFDPPLHEFVSTNQELVVELSKLTGKSVDLIHKKILNLKEANPMLGHRGCRLAITYPEIYDMQVEAITRAACILQKKGIHVIPEIMIPLVGTHQELKIIKEKSIHIIERITREYNITLEYKIGTMIEIPRAALTADTIAEYADFFSFGTNDLTQFCFGYSRDDINSFLPYYIEQKILPEDPFVSIDTDGVGELIKIATKLGRGKKSDLKIGICGEHGGDQKSIQFCFKAGLNYVSCSPLRIPIARLTVAQAIIAEDA